MSSSSPPQRVAHETNDGNAPMRRNGLLARAAGFVRPCIRSPLRRILARFIICRSLTDVAELLGRRRCPRKLALGLVSRILFCTLRCFSRHFSHALLAGSLAVSPACADDSSCSIPVAIGRAIQPPILPCTGRGFSCRQRRRWRGGLLLHLFIMTVPHSANRAKYGYLFSVTLSVDTP
jgi:hypothetical protein